MKHWNSIRVLNFFKKYPIHHIGFMHTNFTTKEVADKHNLIYKNNYPVTDSNIDEINLDKMDLNLFLEEIKRIKKEQFPFKVSFSPELNTEEELHQFYHNPSELIGNKCMDVFSNIMFKSDGSSIPAHGRCYNVNTGNIYENSLPEIWNSQNFSDIRKTLNKAGGLLPGCSRCCSAF